MYDTLWQFVTVCEVEIDLSKPGSQHFVTQDHFLNLPRWSGVAAVMSWLHPAKSETRKQRMGPACVVLVGQDADHDVLYLETLRLLEQKPDLMASTARNRAWSRHYGELIQQSIAGPLLYKLKQTTQHWVPENMGLHQGIDIKDPGKWQCILKNGQRVKAKCRSQSEKHIARSCQACIVFFSIHGDVHHLCLLSCKTHERDKNMAPYNSLALVVLVD